MLVARQIQDEQSLKSDAITGISIGVLVFLLLIALLLFYLYRKNIKVLNNEWLAEKEDIDMRSSNGKFGEIFEYKGMNVAASNDFQISAESNLSWSIRSTLVAAQAMSHTNIEKFVCLAEHQHAYHFIKESYSRGSLDQVIQNSNFKNTYEFQLSIILDVNNGRNCF